MKAPAFWWRPPGLAAMLLGPPSALYGVIASRRLLRSGHRVPASVICVGNVTVGGSGKTPTALAIAALLRNDGRDPAFLLRGYRGSLAGPVAVDAARHRQAEVGDEALLLCRHARTVVARDRLAGARVAASLGHDVVVMDDGLQNPSLAKDLSLAVFDGATGIGNGHVFPAGPLRAPLDAQWPLIDAVVIVGHGSAGDEAARAAAARRVQVLRAVLTPDPAVARTLVGRRVLAFAGIGRPEKFFATLREIGAEVVEAHAFADHYAYRPADIVRLLDRAERASLLPVTTEKDAVRLPVLPGAREVAITALPVTLSFDEPEVVRALVRQRLPPARPA